MTSPQSLFASEEVRRQRFNDICNKLRELKESWDNRLVLEKMSLLEGYLQQRLGIGLIVEILPQYP